MNANETERRRLCNKCDKFGSDTFCTVKPDGRGIQTERINARWCGFAQQNGEQGIMRIEKGKTIFERFE